MSAPSPALNLTLGFVGRWEDFVLGELSRGARVHLAAEAEGIEARLQEQGCVRSDNPEWLVCPQDLADVPDAQEWLRRTHARIPAPRILLRFRNAARSAALVRALRGHGAARGLALGEVSQWLEGLGLHVRVLGGRRGGDALNGREGDPLARALVALHNQVSGFGEAEEIFVAAGPASEAATRRVPLLLSIVLVPGTANAALLDRAVFSLACQSYEPVEIIGAVGTEDSAQRRAVEEALTRYERLGSYRHRLEQPQAALPAAQGQYLAFVGGDWVVYPEHFRALAAALQSSDAAWGLARARYALRPASEGYTRTKVPFPLGEELTLETFFDSPDLDFTVLLDRDRLGSFPLSLPGEGAGLALRLAASSRPAFVGGLGSCERTVEALPTSTREIPRGNLQALAEVSELRRWWTLARAQNDPPLRHRVADALNEWVKRRLPFVHAGVKRRARTGPRK